MNSDALYVYGVVGRDAPVSLPVTGLDSLPVESLVCDELCALAHRCPPLPYDADDAGVVREWALTHDRVIEAALDLCGDVLPLRFNTIYPAGRTTADEAVCCWLAGERDALRASLDRVRGKREYSVQLWCHEDGLTETLAETQPELKARQQTVATLSPGKAYLRRQELKAAVRVSRAQAAAALAQQLANELWACASEVRAEPLPRAEERRLDNTALVGRWACLATSEQAARIGERLEGFTNANKQVRFTGPWAPYSFV